MTSSADGPVAAGARVVLVACLVALGFAGTAAAETAGPHRPAQAVGAVALTVAPDKVTPGTMDVVVRVANSGGGPVTKIVVDVVVPAGIEATPARIDVGDLGIGASLTRTVRLSGTPVTGSSAVVVRAEGTTPSGSTSAVASVAITEWAAPFKVELSGNDRLTDASRADLAATVTNTSNRQVAVELRGSAAGHRLRFVAGDSTERTTTVDLEPHEVEVVSVRVEKDGPLRRGTVSVTVVGEASIPEIEQTFEVAAQRSLTVSLSASELLPGVLGIGTVVLLPGLVGVVLWLDVHRRDRRRLGLSPPSLSAQVWDNKVVFLFVLALSLLAILVYDHLADVNLLDAYEWDDLARVVAGTGLAVWALAQAHVWWHRQQVPVIGPSSDPRAVLAAAAESDGSVTRDTYVVGGKQGLFVHRDGDAVVLAPPILYSAPGTIGDPLSSGNLAGVSNAAKAAGFDGRFETGTDYIAAPGAYADAQHAGTGNGALLSYREPEGG